MQKQAAKTHPSRLFKCSDTTPICEESQILPRLACFVIDGKGKD